MKIEKKLHLSGLTSVIFIKQKNPLNYFQFSFEREKNERESDIVLEGKRWRDVMKTDQF